MTIPFLIQLYIILLIAGLFLVGAEIFVPGGILGVMGGVALLLAIIIAFPAFGAFWGLISAVSVILLVGLVMFLWIKLFPKTSLGKKMTVSTDLHDSKATEDGLSDLINKTGTALSDLRPSGFAMIDGRRTDVVTEGQMISKGEEVEVIEIEGNRVVVAKLTKKGDE